MLFVRLQVDGSPKGTYWQSTGAYALPGQVATVSLPDAVFANGFTVDIQARKTL